MAKMDGLELCKRIRELETDRYTYIVMVTGRKYVQDLSKAFDAGGDDYVKKPYEPMELTARIKAAQRFVELESRRQNRFFRPWVIY